MSDEHRGKTSPCVVKRPFYPITNYKRPNLGLSFPLGDLHQKFHSFQRRSLSTATAQAIDPAGPQPHLASPRFCPLQSDLLTTALIAIILIVRPVSEKELCSSGMILERVWRCSQGRCEGERGRAGNWIRKKCHYSRLVIRAMSLATVRVGTSGLMGP